MWEIHEALIPKQKFTDSKTQKNHTNNPSCNHCHYSELTINC